MQLPKAFGRIVNYNFINQTIFSKGLSNLRTTKQPYVSTSILQNKLLWHTNYNLYAIIYRLNIFFTNNSSYFNRQHPIANSQNLLITFISYTNSSYQPFETNCIIWIKHMITTQLICNESIIRNGYIEDCFVENRMILH